MTSTVEHVASGSLDAMTAKEARYHLRRARERIATLVALLDERGKEVADWRERAKRAERRLAMIHAASATDERLD